MRSALRSRDLGATSLRPLEFTSARSGQRQAAVAGSCFPISSGRDGSAASDARNRASQGAGCGTRQDPYVQEVVARPSVGAMKCTGSMLGCSSVSRTQPGQASIATARTGEPSRPVNFNGRTIKLNISAFIAARLVRFSTMMMPFPKNAICAGYGGRSTDGKSTATRRTAESTTNWAASGVKTG